MKDKQPLTYIVSDPNPPELLRELLKKMLLELLSRQPDAPQ